MINAIRFTLGLILLSIYIPTTYAQDFLLRHQLKPKLEAQIHTSVELLGDSFLTGKKAATKLQMNMLRSLKVERGDSFGDAEVNIKTERIKTSGKMEDTQYNRDLSGKKLERVMFGQPTMKVEISPLGHVKGSDSLPLDQLGINLPQTLSETGGFEFPTFPSQKVGIGDSWTEDGQVIPRNGFRQSDIAQKPVYTLRKVTQTNQGRLAILHYQKKTDLSGLGLESPSSGLGDSFGMAKAVGLIIELEGFIEFNIDKGVVYRTSQKGSWQLNLNLSGANEHKNTGLRQDMRMKLSSRLNWSAPKTNKNSPNQDTPLVPNNPSNPDNPNNNPPNIDHPSDPPKEDG